MITTRWKFLVESFSREYPFYLQEDLPFVGTYESAMEEMDKRVRRWEALNDDTICKMNLEPYVPDDDVKRF